MKNLLFQVFRVSTPNIGANKIARARRVLWPLLVAMSLAACSDENTAVQEPSLAGNSEYSISGTIESEEKFENGGPLGQVFCRVEDDGKTVRIWNQDLEFGSEGFEARRIIQIVDTSQAIQEGGIHELTNDDLKIPAVIVVKEDSSFTLKNSDSCFIIYDPRPLGYALSGRIHCPRLNSTKNSIEEIAVRGSFHCKEKQDLDANVGFDESSFPKE